jgi:hypothetical protein
MVNILRALVRCGTDPSRIIASMQDERVQKILEFCQTPRSRDEIQALIGITP